VRDDRPHYSSDDPEGGCGALAIIGAVGVVALVVAFLGVWAARGLGDALLFVAGYVVLSCVIALVGFAVVGMASR
jgi:hypothetical protein